jgi:small subunit ribosomal protein S16
MGSKNAAFYRVIVQDARRAPTGRFLETLGWYDPKQDGNNFSLNLDRADYWLSNGAQPSDTAASLIKKARTLPVEQAVAGEVTEEEVPVEAVEAEEAAVEAEEAVEEVAEEETPAAVEKVADEAETKEPAAEEAAEASADEPVEADATEEKA